MKRAAQVPGDEPRPQRDGITALNNASDDPNKIARDRERLVQSTAAAATGGEGEIAKGPELDAGPAIREATINGQKVRVHVPALRRNDQVVKYGPESRLPKGTLVRRDGMPTEGDEEAYGVIGDIEIPEVGRLVSRVIPFEAVTPDDHAALGKAAKKKVA